MKKELIIKVINDMVDAGYNMHSDTVEHPSGIYKFVIRKVKHTELKKIES